MSQRFIPGRGWNGGSPGGKARRQIGTSVEGHQMSRKVWICQHCSARNDPINGSKTDTCISCNARRQFGSRVEGHQMSRKVWICQHCRAWNDPINGKKPAECISCKGPASAFLKCDSALEAERFVRLWVMQDAGLIQGLRHQPRYDLVACNERGELSVVVTYVADFEYHRAGVKIVEDVKPQSPDAQDPVFKVKRKFFEWQYGITLRIVSKS